ncbi:MAG: pyruvate dehydrogenase complex dihydrolipoamide acetyltransferase [Saprospiraceae bacterium]|nr:pyruvate dehydrogenase complex dihydrolipoamide acetyltransferase [Saprospiraceae bacterium]MBK6564359.1 pyruvate dehydrogenase complex dihydrolipoamide acetyltransferase [Saprospiraceae bacterium]MBK7523958.1 pyruvate dehydrogenase complex dihydrolipoamide acetyltransferase [Saprospiraceae bacterium]MBK8372011.1 pyruvate dehydrogenase complex dihydrolipoamide acetyltransferase [Saprospiraceae bacterium]MBK8818491.1 pyruvate dehydrogenase complex dihydrolipoamide acetyltransferase [Saprospir
MAEIIRMPRLSDTMEEGNIVSWLKKEGDIVKPGDILAEVETDKATMELESFHSGVLLYIGVKSGPVAVDGIIAIIGKSGDDVAAILAGQSAAAPASNGKSEPVPVEKTAAPTSAPVSEIVLSATTTNPVFSGEDQRLKASPLAKSLASQAGIDIGQIKGSGDFGRIVKKDIELFIQNPKTITSSATGTSEPVVLPDFQYGDVPVSQMRKTIARRLGESKFTAPHFYLTLEINMDKAVEAREAINKVSPVKISYNDMVIKACAASLRKNPAVNSSWFGDKITYHKQINIGVAVAVEDGLLVPVINNADVKPMSSINQEVKDLAGKAKSKKLQPQEMTGNTFTISNLGMFDIEEFTAIINPPDACILAIGSIIKKPIVKNDVIAVGNMMKVTLSCDHRVVDGATGARFLQTFKDYLENPVTMLV